MSGTELADSLYQQGDAAHDAGSLALAEQLLRSALAINPAHWLANYTLAVVLQDGGRHDEAVPLYSTAVASRPDHLKAWNNYGVALQYSGQREQAITAYRHALAIDPGHAGALANLSGLLAELGEVDEARDLLAPYCNPAAPSALDLRRTLMLPPVAMSAEEWASRRATMAEELDRLLAHPPRLVDPLREIGRTPFYLAYQPDSDRDLLVALATLYRRACPSLSYVAPHIGGVPRSGRRRIGFASFFFYDHSVARVMRGLIERLPRDRFEVVAIFLGGRADDSLASAIADAADRVVETPYDLAAARASIAELALDVLCLTDFGMDPLSYFIGFARLAPVQCTTWGHAETSGVDTIDWFVSTEGFERGESDDDYSERLYRLPGVASPSFYERPLLPADGIAAIVQTSGTSYLCTQTVYKLHPDFDDMIAGILDADPDGRVFLARSREPRWNERLATRMARRLGAAIDRVEWLDPMRRADYLATVAAADVILDPPHFVGGNTSLEALALGKPIVTLPGRSMRSRFTAGFYTAMGLDALIARDPAEYVRIATRLGRDPAWRAERSREIDARNAILFDDSAVVTTWVAFFERALAGAQGV